MKQVLLNWQLNNGFGWGILGMNLFFHWSNDPDIRPSMGSPITDRDLAMTDPLRLQRAMPAIIASNQALAGRRPDPDGRVRVDGVVIDGLGNGCGGVSHVFGSLNIGRCIFENTDLSQAAQRLEKYAGLLSASTWNAQLLQAVTGRAVHVVHEGVDESLFCPGPKSGLLDPRRFYVFTGGKIEYRKGQDLTLLAFRHFSQNRPEATLVTAWHSPWPGISAGFQGRLEHPVRLTKEGQIDVGRWIRENGVDPARVIDLGRLPNPLMPAILREMDVCLQPSRAEACTSLPVKEAMACGVPVIAGANTGMLDLLREDNCLPLTRQSPVSAHDAWQTQGWGESDVDEIVSQLEFAYLHRERARAIGAAGRQWLLDNDRTWRAHARSVKSWLQDLC